MDLPIQKLCEHKDKGLAKGFAFDLFGNETTNILLPIPLIRIHFLFYSNVCRLPMLIQARIFFIGLGLLDIRSPEIWTFGLLDFGPRLGRLKDFLLDLDFGPQNLDIVQIFEQVQFGHKSKKFGLTPL